jgi:arsenite-transporting ATPase
VRTAVRADARYRFFGGKGGVGKTTCAAAAAVAAAAAGSRVLAVSTDPAHSLGDAFAVRLGRATRAIRTRRGALAAVELEADLALERWIAERRRTLRTIAERGTYLDENDIDRFLHLSLPGVDELIGLVELARLAGARPYDDVIVDTAPTGHTLRLLTMPETLRRIAAVLDHMQAKHRFLGESLGGLHRPDVADALIDEIEGEGRSLMELLRDPARSRFVWVLLPEQLALDEAKDGIRALEASDITVSEIVVNRVARGDGARCDLCHARIGAEQEMIDAIRDTFPGRTLRFVLEEDREPRGVAALRGIARQLERDAPPPRRVRRRRTGTRRPARSRARHAQPWLDTVAPANARLLLFGGKGGVGKTTCAAAAALALARRDPGRRVLLLSTDPAHSLGDVLNVRLSDGEAPVPGGPANLRAREIDADRAFTERRDRYRNAVDQLFNALVRGAPFDVAFDREVVRELIELAPPGLDELFGILGVVDALFRRKVEPYDTVIVDTAPTGHGLRLLEMPAAALEWVRALLAILLKYRPVVGLGELAADLVEASGDLRQLQKLLTDESRASFIAVTRAAQLPRLETSRLLARLARMEIAVPAVIINAVWDAGCRGCAPTVRRQQREIEALRTTARRRGTLIAAPALAPPPIGVAALEAWSATWTNIA